MTPSPDFAGRLDAAVKALTPAALPFFAAGCVEASIIAHRQAGSLDADTRRAIRALALIALEAFGKPSWL